MKKMLMSILTVAALGTATFAWAADEPAVKDDKTPAVAQEYETVTGTITDVDMDAKTLTVKGAVLSKTFRLGGDAAIEIMDNRKATIGDLREGDEVSVTYKEQGDILWAHKIVRTNAKEHDTSK